MAFLGVDMHFKKMASVILTVCVFGGAGGVYAAGGNSGVLVGVDAREKSAYGYVGLVHNFRENVLDDGLLARVVAYGGRYKYSTPAVVGGEVRADYSALEALLGYQKVFTSFAVRGYLGAEYEGHQLSPQNSFDGNHGGHLGAKVRFDIESDFAAPEYYNLIATYGTARDRYWARGRVGHDFSGYVVGPEVIASGDRAADEERFGVFLNVRTLLPAMLSISAGQARTARTSAGRTPYLTVEYSTSF